jgi:hypothetical protein
MPDVTNAMKPIALGIRSPKRSFLAVWRIDGNAEVRVPQATEILYPKDLGIVIHLSGEECTVTFPRPRMGCNSLFIKPGILRIGAKLFKSATEDSRGACTPF